MRTLLTLAVLLAPVIVSAQERQMIQPPNTSVGLPFSAAVRVGNL